MRAPHTYTHQKADERTMMAAIQYACVLLTRRLLGLISGRFCPFIL